METSKEQPNLPWEDTFRRRVIRLRKAKGLSQTEVARRLTERGITFHQAQVQRIEQGQRPIRLNEAVVLAEVLEGDFVELVSEVNALTFNMDVVMSEARIREIALKIHETLGGPIDDLSGEAHFLEESWSMWMEYRREKGLEKPAEMAAEFERYLTLVTNAASALEAVADQLDSLGALADGEMTRKMWDRANAEERSAVDGE